MPAGSSAWSQIRAEDWWMDPFFEPMFEAAADSLTPVTGQRLLHLGCSLGVKTETLRRLGFEATGVDINADRLRKAAASWPNARFVRASVESLPFPDQSFDTVFSFSVLQLVSPARTIAEAARVVRPGGRVVFMENLLGHPMAQGYRALSRLLGWRYSQFEAPQRHLDLADVSRHFGCFHNVECSVFHLTTPLTLVFPAVFQQIFRTAMRPPPARLHRWLSTFDRGLLRTWPASRRYAWMSVITATKA